MLEVIAAILSEGRSSRFSLELVQREQLVLDAEAENSLLSRDPGLFLISAEPMPGRSTSEVEQALDQQITRLGTEPVSERELQKAQNQLEASFISSQDSLFFRAMLLAQHEIAQDWRTVEQYLPSIRLVTPEDIIRVTQQYLNRDNRTVAVLVPLPPKEKNTKMHEFTIKTKTVR